MAHAVVHMQRRHLNHLSFVRQFANLRLRKAARYTGQPAQQR
ncbi:hypothetical protein [Desulfovibrio psychrotolerans]|nr:hypothetical protein [Desulfovibrio psychrotolerans]